ncbi:MAG: hypothetical protein ABI602_04140 [Candidatus Saccharibacteria bacterium]
MSQPATSPLNVRLIAGAVIGLFLLGFWQQLFAPAAGAQLGNRKLQISDSIASEPSVYALSFDLSSSGNLGSIEIEFCSNSAISGDPCTPPNGLDLSGVILSDQTGQIGFSIDGASTNNRIILSRPAALPAPVGPVSYTFSNVINPDSPGSYYARLQTFAATDASGSASDYGGSAFAINSNLSISAEVPPYIIFCTAVSIPGSSCANADGDYINFGELSSTRASRGSSQMLTATNARYGYSISITGTTLISGNNVITQLTASDVSRPGTPQFGLNLRANTSPAGGLDPSGPGVAAPTAAYDVPNFYRFSANETVATTTAADDLRLYTASYIVNVPAAQPTGVYVSTVTYICLANF